MCRCVCIHISYTCIHTQTKIFPSPSSRRASAIPAVPMVVVMDTWFNSSKGRERPIYLHVCLYVYIYIYIEYLYMCDVCSYMCVFICVYLYCILMLYACIHITHLYIHLHTYVYIDSKYIHIHTPLLHIYK